MALPKVQYPVHVANITGLGEVKIRPFSGHEERALQTAKESNEIREIVAAIDEVLKTCTFGSYGGDNLSSFQVEELFLKIREFSVGPTTDVNITNSYCEQDENSQCPAYIEMEVVLDDANVETSDGHTFDPNEHSKLLKQTFTVTNDIGFQATQPSMNKTSALQQKGFDGLTAQSIAAIDKIFDSDNVYSDYDYDEIAEWYDSLPFNTRRDLVKFVLQAPKLRYRKNWQCPNCNKEHEIKLEGLNAFFG